MSRPLLLEAALRYAELGYAVFPCAPGTKEPLTKSGFHDATIDSASIEAWWTERPNANIGLPTAGLLVLDIDAEATWLADEPEKQRELAGAPLSLTPSGGRHVVFRQPEGRQWRNTASALAPHVDTRADGGYIVAPPSALPGGKAYCWTPDAEFDVPQDRLSEPPAWLVQQLDGLASSSPTLAHVAACPAQGNEIPSGQRNATLAKLAGTMRRVGMSPAEILPSLLRVNTDRCKPSLAPREVHRIVESVGRYAPDEVSVALVENHWEQMLAGELPPALRYTAITSRELAATTYNLSYLIDGVLVRGQPGVIAGPKKTLKTNISIDLALSLGSADRFLERFIVAEAVRVGVMSGESGAATIQETARRIAWSKSWTLENFTNVVWSFDVPQLGQLEHIEALRAFILDHELEVLILDPTYLMMMGLGQDAGNLFIVGSFLKSVGELAQQTGCTPILCHHLRKNVAEPYEPAELENIAWAGFQEFMRQWILLNRRVRYDPDNGGHHELWMSVGGSAGHSGLWGVNIDEGTRQDERGRKWDVDVISAGEAFAERAAVQELDKERRQDAKSERRFSKHRDAVWNAVREHPDGETRKVLRTESKLNPDNFQPVIDELLEDGLVEPCTVAKGGRTFEGYRPVRSSDQADQIGPKPLFP